METQIPSEEQGAVEEPARPVEPEPETERPKKTDWYRDMIEKELKADRIRGGSLVGEIVAFFVLSSVLAFFVVHELRDTGFYTDAFGAFEKFLLFGAGGFAVALVVLRIIVRRKNVIRPLDMASLLFFVVAHAVLLAVFPFDFSYVGDALPSYLSWSVDWMSDTIGKMLLALGVFGGTVGAVFTFATYVGVKKRLKEIETEARSGSQSELP
ncbi:TPA: hypothetical protein HA259_00555 [Thermoplasmata archaeon]|nr:hypothetical protein [Thermoplasmata archaeon]